MMAPTSVAPPPHPTVAPEIWGKPRTKMGSSGTSIVGISEVELPAIASIDYKSAPRAQQWENKLILWAVTEM